MDPLIFVILKDYFQKVMFDSKGRLCSPRTIKVSFHQANPIVFKFLQDNLDRGISISESVYRVMNSIETGPKCEFCEKFTAYSTYKVGYEITCGSEVCLRRGYGKNPHIPTSKEREKISERMKVNNPMFNPKTVIQVGKTQRENGGGRLPFNSEVSISRSLESRFDKYKTFSPKSRLFRSKDYVMPDGKIVHIQGYENKALDILFKTHAQHDIVVCGKKHRFEYVLNNKIRRYYPDVYIPDKRLYIEVKSNYTYQISLEKNLTKRRAVETAGFMFQFWILDVKGNLAIL